MWYRGIAQCGKVHAFQLARSTLGRAQIHRKRATFHENRGRCDSFGAFTPILSIIDLFVASNYRIISFISFNYQKSPILLHRQNK